VHVLELVVFIQKDEVDAFEHIDDLVIQDDLVLLLIGCSHQGLLVNFILVVTEHLQKIEHVLHNDPHEVKRPAKQPESQIEHVLHNLCVEEYIIGGPQVVDWKVEDLGDELEGNVVKAVFKPKHKDREAFLRLLHFICRKDAWKHYNE
jgi:hypothetical protein